MYFRHYLLQIITVILLLLITLPSQGQQSTTVADSLRSEGYLMPALIKYAESIQGTPSKELFYKIASTSALLWSSEMQDTSFFFLRQALSTDSTLKVLYDPDFLSLIDDSRWNTIEDAQFNKYEAKHSVIKNKPFARQLFRMIIRDQGFMYAGNIERKKYIENGGYFRTPAIFPILAQEEKNIKANEAKLLKLLDKYGWPTTSEVTEYAAAGAALIINHSNFELRQMYFPMLEEAFKNGEAQPLRYAKMKDRLLVEQGKKQLYGTQIKFENLLREPFPILNPEFVDKRRNEIGLGPLSPYLKSRFGIEWKVVQKE